MLFAKSTGGFYHPEIHRDIPADAVEISDAEYSMLMSSNKQIVSTADGRPILSDKPGPIPITRGDAKTLLTSTAARVLKNAAGTYAYASLEEVCSIREGAFASDGAFFRELREETRVLLLSLVAKLEDEQDMSAITAMSQEFQNKVREKLGTFVAATGESK